MDEYYRILESKLHADKSLSDWDFDRGPGQTRVTVYLTDYAEDGTPETHSYHATIYDNNVRAVSEPDFRADADGWHRTLSDGVWSQVQKYRTLAGYR